LVALLRAFEADEIADFAELLADEMELLNDDAPAEAELLIELKALEADPERDDAPEAADPVTPPPMVVKIVVLPVMLPAELVKALVVTADEDPPAPPITV
jgi:hypothetical protein